LLDRLHDLAHQFVLLDGGQDFLDIPILRIGVGVGLFAFEHVVDLFGAHAAEALIEQT
jgi:hypothetical protein